MVGFSGLCYEPISRSAESHLRDTPVLCRKPKFSRLPVLVMYLGILDPEGGIPRGPRQQPHDCEIPAVHPNLPSIKKLSTFPWPHVKNLERMSHFGRGS